MLLYSRGARFWSSMISELDGQAGEAMQRSGTGSRGTGDNPVAVMTPPSATGADVSQPGRRMRVLGAWAGIIGPVLLAAYFSMPALFHLPSASASSGTLIAYANAHRTLFYLGGWLQVTGALLSILFFLLLLQMRSE